MIVTSQPDVACDVCGRRLLRGEQPDVFLASGRRRMVCELCSPRASAEGWLRETEDRTVSLPPARPRRGRNLLDRLRQPRERPARDGGGEFLAIPESPIGGYDFLDGGGAEADPSVPGAPHADEPHADGSHAGGSHSTRPVPAVPFEDAIAPAQEPLSDIDAQALRALGVFNAGEHPRRIAGVSRSLGEPSISVRPAVESGAAVVAIVVAWELSWYRYEVDLDDEVSGASVVAQGTELSELADEDRLANGVSAPDGSLSLVGLTAR
jgi:hypothetical protein